MKPYTEEDLKKYLKDDFVLKLLQKNSGYKEFSSHRWLLEIPPKRMIYGDVYGELLRTKGKRILDVGGGFCGASKELIRNHRYTLVDTITHDDQDELKDISLRNNNFWINKDWYNFETNEHYDYVIANDLFPNVDQRLNAFLEKFIPLADSIVVTLTLFDNEKFYTVKRTDAEEILTIKAWDSAMTYAALRSSLKDRKITFEDSPEGRGSLFKNGRKVYKLAI